MTIADDKWFECWYDSGDPIIPVYVLFVTPAQDRIGGFLVIDFFKNKEIVFRAKTYEEVQSWLWADEYSQIEGRVFVDDGW